VTSLYLNVCNLNLTAGIDCYASRTWLFQKAPLPPCFMHLVTVTATIIIVAVVHATYGQHSPSHSITYYKPREIPQPVPHSTGLPSAIADPDGLLTQEQLTALDSQLLAARTSLQAPCGECLNMLVVLVNRIDASWSPQSFANEIRTSRMLGSPQVGRFLFCDTLE
jgi:hypothetical protein